jgi:hypothetical protein
MTDLIDRMELIKTTLAAKYPDRIVTRDLLPFDRRKSADLVKGIYTILGDGEGDYANYNGREGMDGRQPIKIVGQFVLAESVVKETPSAIENAEYVMVEEIKVFLQTRPALLAQLFMKRFWQSRQEDAPYGWVAIDLEFLQ